MDDLIAFWAARLDERERAAKAASRAKTLGDEWRAGDSGDGWTQAGTGVYGPDGNAVAVAIGGYAADHIAFNSPASALADVAADRAILAEYAATVAAVTASARQPGESAARMYLDGERELCALEPVVKIRAARFDGHPDYRPEWKP